MTGWAADRHVTPRVVAHLRDHLPDVPVKNRPSLPVVQCVLLHLCKWARREPKAEHSGMWLTDETVEQLGVQSCLTKGSVRNALSALEHVGLLVTIRPGGGTGDSARGALRRLVLDPVENAGTARGNPAQFRPELRGVAHGTARGTERTARGQPRASASSAFTTYPRAGDAGEVSTTNDDEHARTTYAEYAAKTRAAGKRVLTPAVYFAIVSEEAVS